MWSFRGRPLRAFDSIAFGADFVTKRSYLLLHGNATYRIDAICAREAKPSIKAEGIVRSATGEGKIPFIHPQDIADVATRALTSHEYDGMSLPITGRGALSYAEMAGKIGSAI